MAALEIGKIYELTEIYTMGRHAGEKEVRTIKITRCEDRGEYFYVGWKPANENDLKHGRFGYFKLKKEGQYKAIHLHLKKVN